MNNNFEYSSLKKFYKNKKILITGATGFKGSWLAFWLYKIGAKVFTTGNNPNKTKGFISNFLYTKPLNVEALSKNINVYMNEGDSFSFK